MGKYLTTTHLKSALSYLIESTDRYIILVSPFINLLPNIKSLLEEKKNNPKMELIYIIPYEKKT